MQLQCPNITGYIKFVIDHYEKDLGTKVPLEELERLYILAVKDRELHKIESEGESWQALAKKQATSGEREISH